jgi:hypothetical protein
MHACMHQVHPIHLQYKVSPHHFPAQSLSFVSITLKKRTFSTPAPFLLPSRFFFSHIIADRALPTVVGRSVGPQVFTHFWGLGETLDCAPHVHIQRHTCACTHIHDTQMVLFSLHRPVGPCFSESGNVAPHVRYVCYRWRVGGTERSG